MVWKKLKDFYMTLSTAALFGAWIVILLTYFCAYQQPSKSVTITINRHNEADIEIFLFTFTIPGVIYLFIKVVNWFREENYEETEKLIYE